MRIHVYNHLFRTFSGIKLSARRMGTCFTPLMFGLLVFGLLSETGRANNLPTANEGLFGSREIMSKELSAFKKWNGMLARSKEAKPSTQPCRQTTHMRCPIDVWQEMISDLKQKSSADKISEVNRHMNKAPYITDMVNWGVRDYWASLKQFFRKDGDCEDYAIAKYFSLKELGIPGENMRIVVVHDTSLNIPHAVLVVYADGEKWILDNQIGYVVKEKAVLHYRPLYSINEEAWWLHRM